MDSLDLDAPTYRHTHEPPSLERLCIDCLLNHREILLEPVIAQNINRNEVHEPVKTSAFPPAIADHIFECLVKPLERIKYSDIAIFCDANRFKLTRVHIVVPIERAAAVRLLEAHRDLRELVIADCSELRREFVIKVLERGQKLSVLHLGNVIRMLGDFCKWLEGEEVTSDDVSDSEFGLNREESQVDDSLQPSQQSREELGDLAQSRWNANPSNSSSIAVRSAFERTLLDATSLDNFIHAIGFPALRYFAVHAIPSDFSGDAAFDQLISRFAPTLTHIDLSNSMLCPTDFGWLKPLSRLRTLILFNCFEQPLGDDAVDTIGSLTELRRLDISRCASDEDLDSELPIAYDQPDETLSRLVNRLCHLVFLDISGTNLPGQMVESRTRRQAADSMETVARVRRKNRTGNVYRAAEANMDCSIAGLAGFRLDFLGLFGCPFDACRRDRLPARCVAGTRDETQLICSLRMYRHRAELVRRALDALFNVYRSGQPVAASIRHEALHAVLEAMRIHRRDRLVLISGSATLFYLVQNAFTENRDQFDEQDARSIISCLISAAEHFETDATMIRNTCLTICKFRLPEQVIFVYERLVRLLLRVAKKPDHENFSQRVSIFLLNILACNVDDREKLLLGELGTVECMLDIIHQKLVVQLADEVLDTCWSVLWNITDETPFNCRRFIDYTDLSVTGLQVFTRSLDQFSSRPELLRNCMGLMGNVAEVKHLRPFLMTSTFIDRFDKLLFDTSDGIEIAYNSAGVLSHILSDGAHVWHISKPSREKVSEDLMSVLSRWDLTAERNINYRSFKPIMRLVADFENSAAQAWSVWALCNLTCVYPDKYCSMLKSRDSLIKLAKVANSGTVLENVRNWANDTLQRVVRKVYDSVLPDFVTAELELGRLQANASSLSCDNDRSDDEHYEDAQSHL